MPDAKKESGMGRYQHTLMSELAAQMQVGLIRLRKGQADAAESLFRLIDPSQDYPYEFVVFRLTGYRPASEDKTSQTIPGQMLLADLRTLVLDLSGSFVLTPADYSQPVYDAVTLSRRLRISGKTLQRWRRGGLIARRLVYPDGRRRLAFLEESVRWFIRQRRQRVLKSMRFSQMSRPERDDILRRARRMASFTHATLHEISHRLAAHTGRAAETIRYTIRNFDRSQPRDAIFPQLGKPLDETEKMVMYRCFLRGVAAPHLAGQYGRSRGSVYRIINEMRGRQLMQRPLHYIYNPQFDLPAADELILAVPAASENKGDQPEGSDGSLLDASTERNLFRRYNYLKYKVDKLRRMIDLNRVRAGRLKEIENLLLQANAVKHRIIRANLRLVGSIAARHTRQPQSLMDLVSDGNLTLMKAVETFDYSRGFRFSTYASWSIMRQFARCVPKEQARQYRFGAVGSAALEWAAHRRMQNQHDMRLPELRESVEALLAQLSPPERAVLINHYGLEENQPAQTLEQLSLSMGISRQRIRRIEAQAMEKLRGILGPDQSDLLV